MFGKDESEVILTEAASLPTPRPSVSSSATHSLSLLRNACN